MSYIQGSPTQTINLAVDTHTLPIRVIVMQGSTADCTQAIDLIAGISAKYSLTGDMIAVPY